MSNNIQSFDPDFDDDDDDFEPGEGPLKVEFDLPALLQAWQDDSPDNSYYLDTTTGAVKLVNPNLFDLKELTDEIERHKYRYLYLPKPQRGEIKDNLKDFQKTVENADLVRILDMAFESPHFVDAFVKILSSNPEELARFREFRESRALLRLKQWLQANSLHDRWQI
jgi:hypothetical protein